MIFILNKQEKVVNILRNGGGANEAPPFFDDIYSQDLATGAETFSFSTVAINNVARDLVVGNYVAFKNDEGEYKLFQITQTEEYHEDAMYMSVYAEGAGLELINKVFRARKSPSTSLRKFMEMVLDETGWSVGTIPFSAQESLDLDLEDATVYATLQNTLSKYGVEMAFRCEINNGRISSKFVDLYTQRGRVTGKRFSFGRDIEGIRRKVDSTELFTALIGRGNSNISFKDITVDGINKPLGQDFVADQDAYDRYNNNGYHIIGIFNYDTDSPEELLRETYKQLQKCKEPKIEYEVSVALLGELLGESWNKVSIGDTVAIADNAFNPPIHLMARVSKLDKSFTDNQSDTCTLSNFIEVKSNITDEMRKLASQLEGYVDGALDNKFPIGGDDIQEGAIGSTHIYKDTITTDHLIADAVTANKIKAESIETKHLTADSIKSEHISAGQIEAEHIKSGTITADKIEVGTITAESGIIADATIGTAQIKDAEITVAKIQNAFVDSLVANQGKFQSAHIGVLTSDNIDAGTIKAEHIQASVIDAINLNVEGKISADKIEAIKMEVEEIDAEKITTGTLDADRITSSVITAINASIEDATINSAKIGELDAGKITTGSLSADLIKTNVISAINASMDNATINSAKIGNISADKITTGYLSSDRIEAGTIDASKISADAISSIEVSASKITADKIASGEIKVGDANIVDGSISGAKITKASISNAQIDEAFVADAYIQNITADKIKGGTLDAKEITVTNLNADSITVGQINGKQIAGGAIGYDKLDEILSDDIKNTIANVDKTLEDVGLVQEKVDKSVKSVDVEYAQSNSSTIAPETGWQTSPPKWTDGSFIWSRTTTVLADGTSSTTDPVCITGAKGATGSTGKGVKSTSVTYQASSSGTTTPNGSWLDTIPTVGAGQYLWTRTITTYTDNSTVTSYSIGKMGTNGTNGANGTDGKGIKSTSISYQASTSGTTVPSGTWVSSIPSVSAGQFLWTKTVITYTDNATSTSYSVGKMGEKGETGATGQGVESITEEYYLSNSKTTQEGSSWKTEPPTWSSGKYMWTRSKIVYKNPAKTVYTEPVCDNSWEAVNEIEVGGRNLIVKSSKLTVGYLKSDGSAVTTDTNWYYTDYIPVVAGKQYITSGYKNLGNAPSTCFYNSSKTFVSGINNGNSVTQATETTMKNDKRRLVTVPTGCSYMRFSFEKVDIDKIKLELGNKATDYTPAPEDVAKEIATVTTIANGKNSVYYSTSAPSTTGKKENDIWFDTDDGYRMYSFTGGKWVATQFGTNAIKAEAITGAKIAGETITAGKIASGAITTEKLYALSVTSDKVDANAITAGKIATDAVVANNIKAGAVTTDKIYAKAVNADKLDVDNLFVGDNAFIKKLKAVEIDASNIVTGTISNERIDIKGLVSFEAFDEDLQKVFTVTGNKTYVNGGMIATNTIKASSIDLLSGLTVKGQDGQNTFSIASNGEVEVNGLLKSGNFDEDKNTGYKLSTDGRAILNQAVVKGDVILPSAGMTNYGAVRGNDNLITKSSDLYKSYSTGQYYHNVTGTTMTLSSLGLKAGDTITFRVYIKATGAKGARARISHYYGDGTNYATSLGNIIELGKEGYSTITVTLRSDAIDKGIFLGINSSDTSTTTSAVGQYKEAKLEKGSTATPWCVHDSEQFNQVRLWAGTSYDNRNSAKFRVYDNGDIYATNGTFSGKMYGDLDSGLVHIHNNEIVINSTSTFMDDSGEVRSVEPMDYNPNPYLRLGAGTSLLNTDLILGSESDKKIEFLNSNREFNLNNTKLNLQTTKTDNGAYVEYNPTQNWAGAFKIGSNVTNTDSHLSVGYSSGTWANTAIITHNGSSGSTYGDICFRRYTWSEDVNVMVQGNLKVKNSIQSSTQNIEMRSVSNEGWGFYAT